jgi:DNA-binding transcriptional MerR regulator
MPTFTTTQAASQLQTTASTIRNYARDDRFTPYLSAGATPPAGQTRRLSDSDLQAIAFIRQQEAAGAPLDEIADRMKAGEHKEAEYTPPPDDTQQSRALVLASAVSVEFERYHAREDRMTAALFEAGRSIARAEARNVALEEEVARLENELEYLRQQADNAAIVARLEAELADVRRPIGLLARLLGYRR